jgi:penicillin-binding protein 1B
MKTSAVNRFGTGPVPPDSGPSRRSTLVGQWSVRVRNRLFEVVRNPHIQIVAAVILVAFVGVFFYFWKTASELVDRHLAGEIFESRSGIYAAPLALRPGQPLSQDELITYLQQLGYGSAESEQGSGFVGRFAVAGNRVVVEPLDEAVLASGRYRSISIEFAGERGIVKIFDASTQEQLKEAHLEPLLLSSARHRKEKRIAVAYDAIPATLRNAIVTTEDRRFWKHNGVDYRGIARAVRENLGEGGIAQGGSTITQQLVKNVLLTPDRTFTRKIKEAFVSYVLESRLDKEQIFALYCNEVYLGESGTYAVHGVAEACRRYFGKDLAALSLDESALLAGLIFAPNSNSPYRYPERATARRNLVLDMMAEARVASRDEVEAAKAKPIVLQPPTLDSAWLDAPYFNDYLHSYLEAVLPTGVPDAGRFQIATTLDINLQRAATDIVNEQLARLDAAFAKGPKRLAPGTVQASLIAIEAHTGAVVAMVGGRDYGASQFNRATDAARQPGSVFKPFVYATALGSGRFTAATMLMDAPQKFTYANGQTYEPGNFGESYFNKPIPLRMAFRNSKNVPTVELALRTGLGSIIGTAERAGLPRPAAYPSIALGVSEATPLQVAEAYTAFANGGLAREPTPIESVSGGVLRAQRASARTVMSPQVASLMTDLMSDVVNRGTGAAVRARGLKGAVAGKTGTSRDGWFAGYTPNLVCVVWVGFDDGRQLGLTGADSALPIWTEFMKKALAFRPDLGGESFPRASGLTRAPACDEAGSLAGTYCPSSHEEIFLAGTVPPACSLHIAPAEIPLMLDENGNVVGLNGMPGGVIDTGSASPRIAAPAAPATPATPNSIPPAAPPAPVGGVIHGENQPGSAEDDAGSEEQEDTERPSTGKRLRPGLIRLPPAESPPVPH